MTSTKTKFAALAAVLSIPLALLSMPTSTAATTTVSAAYSVPDTPSKKKVKKVTAAKVKKAKVRYKQRKRTLAAFAKVVKAERSKFNTLERKYVQVSNAKDAADNAVKVAEERSELAYTHWQDDMDSHIEAERLFDEAIENAEAANDAYVDVAPWYYTARGYFKDLLNEEKTAIREMKSAKKKYKKVAKARRLYLKSVR